MKTTKILWVLGLGAILAGCGKIGPHVASEAERGPVVAKVNGLEIYQGQVSAVLSRFGNIPADKLKSASKQVLDKIVEETIILQQAQAKKLDQDAKVIQAINAARNEIMIKAYLDQASANAPAPSDAEIQTFFENNPVLFKERKIYRLRELSVNAKPEVLATLQSVMVKAKSMEEVIEWLKAQKVAFSVSVVAKAAEQLPLELVPKFAAQKEGGIVVIPTQNGVVVEQLLASQVQPVDLATAKPAIERVLLSQKRTEMASNEVKQQRQAAKIEYLGEYAETSVMDKK